MHLADRPYELSRFNATTSIVSAQDGRVVATPQRRKVIITGASRHAHDQAPLDDPEFEVWALNVVPIFDREGRLRCDRWFELHQHKAQSDDDLRWIAACPVPLYVPDDLMAYSPMAVRYPIERMEGRFGNYWTCTFAYQMALAMDEGFTDIGLYGVELALGTPRERSVEWACVSWWMGYAEASGITIHLPRRSWLGQHRYRYGLEYDEEKRYVELYIKAHRLGDRQRYSGVEVGDDEDGLPVLFGGVGG